MNNAVYREQFKKRMYVFALLGLEELEKISTKDLISQVILKQVIRSLTSIGANFVGVQASSSRKDFANFIGYSLKSANETKFWLALLRDRKKMEKVRARSFEGNNRDCQYAWFKYAKIKRKKTSLGFIFNFSFYTFNL